MKSSMVKKHKMNSKTRRSGVILERIEDKVDLLIERQNGMDESINAKLDSHT